jgi:hypothetical protein
VVAYKTPEKSMPNNIEELNNLVTQLNERLKDITVPDSIVAFIALILRDGELQRILRDGAGNILKIFSEDLQGTENNEFQIKLTSLDEGNGVIAETYDLAQQLTMGVSIGRLQLLQQLGDYLRQEFTKKRTFLSFAIIEQLAEEPESNQ